MLQSHGNKTASERYLASFVLQSFCFDSFARFSASVLVVWALHVASILEAGFRFTKKKIKKNCKKLKL